MSRLLLTVLAALFLFPVAHAQTTFGLRAGLNVSTFTGDSATNLDPKLGFSGGVVAMVPLGASGLFVQPELTYSMKGARQAVGGDVAASVDYVEVPLLLGFAAPVTETGLVIGAYAGPTLGLKVREDVVASFGAISFAPDTDAFRSTDVGAAVGAMVGAGPFAVDARYTLGLGDALSDDVNGELRNNVFTISGVYRFGR